MGPEPKRTAVLPRRDTRHAHSGKGPCEAGAGKAVIGRPGRVLSKTDPARTLILDFWPPQQEGKNVLLVGPAAVVFCCGSLRDASEGSNAASPERTRALVLGPLPLLSARAPTWGLQKLAPPTRLPANVVSHRKVTYKGRTGGTDPLTHHTAPQSGGGALQGSGVPHAAQTLHQQPASRHCVPSRENTWVLRRRRRRSSGPKYPLNQ